MGFLRNLKIKAWASSATSQMMQMASRLRAEETDMAPDVVAMFDLIGDQLAIMARDAGLNEKERVCVVQGLRDALDSARLSPTARENIIASLVPRVMAGRPVSGATDEFRGTGTIS